MANHTATRLLARIWALREAHGLTQEAFAELTGLTYKHCQQVESGRKFDIRLSTLIKLADGLGLKLSEIVDFDPPPAVVAEDAAKGRDETTPGKGAGKVPRHRASGKAG